MSNYKCYYCKRTFHNEESAAYHFGKTMNSIPLCQKSGNEWVEYTRELEVFVDELQNEIRSLKLRINKSDVA